MHMQKQLFQTHSDSSKGIRRCIRRHVIKHIRGDYNVAWPTGELAVMGADGAVEIIHRSDIANSRNAEQERDD